MHKYEDPNGIFFPFAALLIAVFSIFISKNTHKYISDMELHIASMISAAGLKHRIFIYWSNFKNVLFFSFCFAWCFSSDFLFLCEIINKGWGKNSLLWFVQILTIRIGVNHRFWCQAQTFQACILLTFWLLLEKFLCSPLLWPHSFLVSFLSSCASFPYNLC